MALKATIAKADFETLDESLKGFYKQSGDNYILDAEGVEDVSGLKAKRDELLLEIKKRNETLKQYEGIDVEAAKKALKDADKRTEEELLSKSKFDELRAKIENEATAKISAAETKLQELTNTLKTEKALNFLTQSGVLPERARYALTDIASEIELDVTANGFGLKVVNGIGDAKELELLVEKLKTSSPFLFAATQVPGSGANGSDNGAKASGAKTIRRADFDALGNVERAAKMKEGFVPVD